MSEQQAAGFRICRSKGFHITFENGWTVSVQFGYGNYCDNYDSRESFGERNDASSSNAECAAINPAGDLVELPDFMFDAGSEYRDSVSNRSTPARVLQLINWVAAQ